MMAKYINIFGINNTESENNNATVNSKDVILSRVKWYRFVKSLNVEKKVRCSKDKIWG